VFGTTFVMMVEVSSIRAQGGNNIVKLSDETEVISKTVILATGVSYRRLDVAALDQFAGVGVFYGSATSEAPALRGQEVFIVGGGNFAGQAAMHLAKYASNVTLLVRGGSLAESMSSYLIVEMEAAGNVHVRPRTEVIGGGGRSRLEYLLLRDAVSGIGDTVATAALFVMIGAKPFTSWLPAEIERDDWGYVLTGGDATRTYEYPIHRPQLLETTMPGVYAVGDVRAGSVKRVASAVGAASIAIRLVHDHLAERDRSGESAI
jgi:thioredoxin reductase (NADPH)